MPQDLVACRGAIPAVALELPEPTSAILRAHPPDRLKAIRGAMGDGVRRYADGDEFVLPRVARVVSARGSGDDEFLVAARS